MTLPFKISAQPKTTQKAFGRFVKTYGKTEGERIFLQYAEDHGTGRTVRQKVNSVFRKGAHINH